jgi:hypothetical protein
MMRDGMVGTALSLHDGLSPWACVVTTIRIHD